MINFDKHALWKIWGQIFIIDIIIEKYKKEPEKRNNLKEDKEVYRHIAAHMAQ